MNRKISGIATPTPLIPIKNSGPKRISGLKPPTNVLIPIPKVQKINQVLKEVANVEPQKEIQIQLSEKCENIAQSQMSFTIHHEISSDDSSSNKTFTIDNSDQIIKNEQLDLNLVENLEALINKDEPKQHPHSHYASYCVSLLEPHADWLRHDI